METYEERFYKALELVEHVYTELKKDAAEMYREKEHMPDHVRNEHTPEYWKAFCEGEGTALHKSAWHVKGILEFMNPEMY